MAVERANWLNVYSKVWIKCSMVKYPCVGKETRLFIQHIYLGGICLSVLTPSFPAKAIYPCTRQKSFEQRL